MVRKFVLVNGPGSGIYVTCHDSRHAGRSSKTGRWLMLALALTASAIAFSQTKPAAAEAAGVERR
jgi:hypothetical protein